MAQGPVEKQDYSSSRFSMFSSENKTLMGLIVAISLFFMIIAYFLYSQYQASLDENYDKFGTMVASVVSAGGAERLESEFSPELKLKHFVDKMLEHNNDLSAIEFHDAEGNVIYENHKLTDGPVETNPRVYSSKLIINDTGDQKYLGSVHVKLSGETIQDISNSTRNILLIVFICAWVLTLISVSANTYILHKHLKRLVQGVKRLSTGDFGYRIPEEDLWGELKTLAESFNDMSLRLRAYEDQNLDTITFERNKMEAVLLSIADGTIVCNNDGEVSMINNSACKHLAIDSSDLMIGRNIREYVTTEGNKCFETVINEFEELMQEHDGVLPAVFTKQLDLPGITLALLISNIQDAEGSDLGFVLTTHDITREAEVDKLKTNFISNVSHELRTPVTTIKSYVDTIYNHSDELDEETYKEFIETIHVETDRLKKMVNDILDFSRLEEAGDTFEMDYEDLTPLINLTVQSFKVIAQQKQLSITTAIESNLPKAYINSDTIERVMRNLLSNAIKYTEDGGRIRVRAEVNQAGDAIEVFVQDSGIGIAEEHLDKIFDRFFRVENEVHTVKGTGLGLHLVRTAIETHHHGEVFVESEIGVGTTFGFRLFLNAPDEVPEKVIEQALEEELIGQPSKKTS